MINKTIKKITCRGIILFLISLPTLTGCESPHETHYTLGGGHQILAVAVRTGDTSFYTEKDRQKGIEHDLLELFANRTSRTLNIRPTPSITAALNAIKTGTAAIAAGLLTIPQSEQAQLSGPYPYLINHQEIVYRYDIPALKTTSDIVMKDIDIIEHPTHLNTLTKIKQQNNDPTQWYLNKTLSSHQLFKFTEQGFVNYAVMDSVETRLFRLYYPSVNQSFQIAKDIPITWVISKDNHDLYAEIKEFFVQIEKSNELANIIDRYYGYLEQMDYSEKLTFIKNFDQRLTRYRPVFVEVAKTLNLDWKLLAAISYQESHWVADAVSPSGVVGMMMITKEIAQQFDSESREEPVQNIIAGTKYFSALKQRLSKNIVEPDRTWMALAAYNSGFGNLQKIIKQTSAKKMNPALWINIRHTLNETKINQKSSKKILNYVYNIRAYYNLIKWLDDQIPTEQTKEKPAPHITPFAP